MDRMLLNQPLADNIRSAVSRDVPLDEDDSHALVPYHCARQEVELSPHEMNVRAWRVRSGLEHRAMSITLDNRHQAVRISLAERAPAPASHRSPGNMVPPSPGSPGAASATLTKHYDEHLNESVAAHTAESATCYDVTAHNGDWDDFVQEIEQADATRSSRLQTQTDYLTVPAPTPLELPLLHPLLPPHQQLHGQHG